MEEQQLFARDSGGYEILGLQAPRRGNTDEIGFLLEGGAWLEAGQHRVELAAPAVYFIPAGGGMTLGCTDAAVGFALCRDAKDYTEQEKAESAVKDSPVCLWMPATDPVLLAGMDYVRAADPVLLGWRVPIIGMLGDIALMLLMEQQLAHHGEVAALVGLLAGPQATQKSLADCARELGRSVSTVKRMLRERLHTSFTRLVRSKQRYLMLQAMLEARAEDKLATIAYRLGFSTDAHFSRRFKQLVGMMPKEFRRMLQR